MIQFDGRSLPEYWRRRDAKSGRRKANASRREIEDELQDDLTLWVLDRTWTQSKIEALERELVQYLPKGIPPQGAFVMPTADELSNQNSKYCSISLQVSTQRSLSPQENSALVSSIHNHLQSRFPIKETTASAPPKKQERKYEMDI